MTEANEMPVLSVQKLTVSFGGKSVIHDLSFEVTRGSTATTSRNELRLML